MNLPGKNMINAGMLTTQLAMAGAFLGADAATGLPILPWLVRDIHDGTRGS